MELIDRTPRDSPLVRVPVAVKLLVITAISIYASRHDTRFGIGLTVLITIVLYAIGRVPPGAWAHTLKRLWPFVVVLAIYEVAQGHPEAALLHALRLVALISLGFLITATTPFEEMVEFVLRVIEPFRRFGAKPESVALAVGMTLRFVPLLAAAGAETADAFRARGVRPWPWRIVYPLIRRTLLLADDVGVALTARQPGDPG